MTSLPVAWRQCATLSRVSAAASRSSWRFTTTPPRFRTAPSPPQSCRRRWRGALARRLCRPRLGPGLRRAQGGCLCALRRLSASTFRARRRRCQCAALDPHREIEQSLKLIEQSSTGCRRANSRPVRGRAGLARVLASRGLSWRRARFGSPRKDGAIERCHLRDPSWFQWPVLEAAIEGNIVADFPLCNKSFNCSYSGHDL